MQLLLLTLLLTSLSVQGLPQCPEVVHGAMRICITECSEHSDCGGGKLCCPNGCGQECVMPSKKKEALLSSAGASHRCVLLAVLSDRGAVKAAKAAKALLVSLPTPAKSHVLALTGILTVEYTPAQLSECCLAFSHMRGSKAVSSVEFDGALPSCSEI
ncbi:unnamed protein product [Polarella glacialis]|uniref:WAP domain-containing protein n=1 Tax=Polarella glacialis TaxID=89957 RepID=A0A813FRP8_POLGL|nr:unnamed protein product [Polarella glacialis]